MLFDEQCSAKVARALKALDLRVEHVGGDGQPEKGAEDQQVLAHAKRNGQTIVTQNNDMVVLCAESQEFVVWIDPKGRDISLAAMVRICFEQVKGWEDALRDANDPICVRVRKTTWEIMELDRAKRIALERGKRRRRTQERRGHGSALGDLLAPEEQ